MYLYNIFRVQVLYLSMNAAAYTDANVCVCVCVCVFHATAQAIQETRELLKSTLHRKLVLPDNLDRW